MIRNSDSVAGILCKLNNECKNKATVPMKQLNFGKQDPLLCNIKFIISFAIQLACRKSSSFLHSRVPEKVSSCLAKATTVR